jgi:hypothetical protein
MTVGIDELVSWWDDVGSSFIHFITLIFPFESLTEVKCGNGKYDDNAHTYGDESLIQSFIHCLLDSVDSLWNI